MYAKENNNEELAKLAVAGEIPDDQQLPLKAKKIRHYQGAARRGLAAVQKKAEALREALLDEEAGLKATLQSCEHESAKNQILSLEKQSEIQRCQLLQREGCYLWLLVK